MQITTMGLVIREVKTGESDRIITILTKNSGIISAIAKGSLRLKNKLFSSTGLFCYSEFTLFEGKTMYIVDEAEVNEVFFGMRQSVEAMALAMYCAELANTFNPQGEEAGDILKLLLNCLYFASEKKREYRQIKIIFEMRLLSSTGYMPNLIACDLCSKYDGADFYFNVVQANLLCKDCCEKQGIATNLSPSALAAMRHMIFADDNKLFNFTVNQDTMLALDFIITQYVCACVEHPMRTLEFLQSVL